ncbi:hypothetical protein J6590_059617 [Homalodisca vitripennis]|nr:hypothetical protein J6590_059617 [Homalodisca vitripennis]
MNMPFHLDCTTFYSEFVLTSSFFVDQFFYPFRRTKLQISEVKSAKASYFGGCTYEESELEYSLTFQAPLFSRNTLFLSETSKRRFSHLVFLQSLHTPHQKLKAVEPWPIPTAGYSTYGNILHADRRAAKALAVPPTLPTSIGSGFTFRCPPCLPTLPSACATLRTRGEED